MEAKKQYYRNRALRLIKQMEKRQMAAWYFETAKEAVDAVLKQIPEGAQVGWGGTVTMEETGLKEKLRNGNYDLLDRDRAGSAQEKAEIQLKALGCDYFVMSSNAITTDGRLVNIDGRGNRLSALIYGPRNIIIIAGMNKVVDGLDEALSRVKNEASPMNANRLGLNTPCAETGSCADCLSADCICSSTVITRRSMEKDRIKVFLIGEDYGF